MEVPGQPIFSLRPALHLIKLLYTRSLWCWISDSFPHERLSLEYYWFWTTAAFIVAVYAAALLHAYGYLIGHATRSGLWIGVRTHPGGNTLRFALYERRDRTTEYRSSGFQLWTLGRGDYDLIIFAVVIGPLATSTMTSGSLNGSGETVDQISKEMQEEMDRIEAERQANVKRARDEAKLMIWYPTGIDSSSLSFQRPVHPHSLPSSSAYIVVILPQSVIRIRYFHTGHTEIGATIVGGCIFALSGLFNVLLYCMTDRFKFDLGPDPQEDD